MFEGRKTTLKPHKDGRLVMEIERMKGDAELTEPEGWLAKKTKWVRVFETVIHDKEDDEIGASEYDNLLRAIKTPAKQFLGWVVHEGRRMGRQPGGQRQDAAATPGQRQGRLGVHHGRRSRQELATGQPSLS